MTGYEESYVNDFTGTTVPSGWEVYTGAPGGTDPSSQWAQSHVVVSAGLLQLNTWQDPAFGGEWVTGGLCQCGVAQTYGAYFVRSRVTGPGPTQVELLWPSSGWPPEVDFDETGGDTISSMATLHYSSSNQEIHNTISVDMTQWHTWGVIWTPSSISYTLDGAVWAQVDIPADMPDQPMILDIQQQTWCGVTPNPNTPSSCPTSPQSTLVDWVAEYQSDQGPATPPTTTTTAPSPPPAPPPSTTTTTIPKRVSLTREMTLRPFAADSASLTDVLRRQITVLAKRIYDAKDSKVVLTGYSDSDQSGSQALSLSRARALNVERFLRQRLADLSVSGVAISVTWDGNVGLAASNSTPIGGTKDRSVLARIS